MSKSPNKVHNPSPNCVHNNFGPSPSEWILSSDEFICKLSIGRSLHTHPPESTGETTRTKGGSKGKLSCHMKENETWVLRKPFPFPQNTNWQILWQDSLYKRNWAECSPLLPFLLRPASHYVMDYLGLPCNKEWQVKWWMIKYTQHNKTDCLQNVKINLRP